MKKISKNIFENEKIAQFFVEEILTKKVADKSATIVALSGDLGAGKTSFTQAVARHFGIKNKINSPTFVLIKKYPIKKGTHNTFFHIDAYRLKNEHELLYLGWEEIIKNKDHIVFIEWPENVKKIIPKGSIPIKISHTKEGYRKFEFK